MENTLNNHEVSPLMKSYLKDKCIENEDKKPMSCDEYMGKDSQGVSPMMKDYVKKRNQKMIR